MQYILRLETEDGTGVYSSGVTRGMADNVSFNAYSSYTHPCPWDDSRLVDECESLKSTTIGRYLSGSRKCGFRDTRQFRQWFYNDEALRYASEHGIKLCIYHASDCIIGNSQCVFDTASADLVARLDCTASNEDIEAAIERHKASQ